MPTGLYLRAPFTGGSPLSLIDLTPTWDAIVDSETLAYAGVPLTLGTAAAKQHPLVPGSTTPGTTTTDPILTQASESTLLIMIARGEWATGSPTAPSDNKSNAISLLAGPNAYSGFPSSKSAVYAAFPNAFGGNGHTATVNWGSFSGTAQDEATIVTLELKSIGKLQSSAFVERAGAGTITSTSVTTTGPALIIAFVLGTGNTGQLHTFKGTDGFIKITRASVEGDPDPNGYIQASAFYRYTPAAGTFTGTFSTTASEGAQIYLLAFQAGPPEEVEPRFPFLFDTRDARAWILSLGAAQDELPTGGLASMVDEDVIESLAPAPVGVVSGRAIDDELPIAAISGTLDDASVQFAITASSTPVLSRAIDDDAAIGNAPATDDDAPQLRIAPIGPSAPARFDDDAIAYASPPTDDDPAPPLTIPTTVARAPAPVDEDLSIAQVAAFGLDEPLPAFVPAIAPRVASLFDDGAMTAAIASFAIEDDARAAPPAITSAIPSALVEDVQLAASPGVALVDSDPIATMPLERPRYATAPVVDEGRGVLTVSDDEALPPTWFDRAAVTITWALAESIVTSTSIGPLIAILLGVPASTATVTVQGGSASVTSSSASATVTTSASSATLTPSLASAHVET